MEEASPRFEARATYDLPTMREINRFYPLFQKRFFFLRIFLIVALVYLIGLQISVMHLDDFVSWYYLILSLIVAAVEGIKYLRNRSGGIAYKRILSNNNGVPPKQQILFCEDGIHCFQHDVHNSHVLRYAQIRSIGRTNTLLILFLEYSQYAVFYRDTLTGGTEAELLQYLIEHCPQLKPKKLRTAKPGRIVNIIAAVIAVIGMLVSVYCLEPVQAMIEESRSINNTMAVSEIAEELSRFDITVPPDNIQLLDAYYSEYENDPYYDFQPNKIIDLLSWAGGGVYDETTWEWTPAQNGVFWFDCEAMDVTTMYTDFLRGVSALNSDELDFTDITENIDCIDLDSGSGSQLVEFHWDGQTYHLVGEAYYDWFNVRVANDLNDIIENRNTGKRLYFMSDGGQGYLVFYRDPQWARAFTQATGIRLQSNIFLTWF